MLKKDNVSSGTSVTSKYFGYYRRYGKAFNPREQRGKETRRYGYTGQYR